MQYHVSHSEVIEDMPWDDLTQRCWGRLPLLLQFFVSDQLDDQLTIAKDIEITEHAFKARSPSYLSFTLLQHYI